MNEPQDLVGKIINGKYEVLDILGEGGMGIVYKVRHMILQKNSFFALKVLHPSLCADKHLRIRFTREVEVAMDLTHENIVQIRDFGFTEDNLPFFTMDFVEGPTLKSLLKEAAPFPAERTRRICRQLFLAVEEAHRSNVVHRDLKPDNVLVAEHHGRERVKVLDFGIAKILEREPGSRTLTRGETIGTPRYMSPEQASGESVDGRSDLYSLGILMYEMLTGKTPFNGNTTRGVLMAQITATPPPLKTVRPELDVPAVLEDLVFRLLAKNPDDRPDTALACLELLDQGRLATTRQTLARDAGRRRGWRRTVRVASMVGAAAVLIAGLGFALRRASWLSGADALAEDRASPALHGGSPAAAGLSEAPASPPPAVGGGDSAAGRFRCEVCNETFDPGSAGDMEFMHHALPMVKESL